MFRMRKKFVGNLLLLLIVNLLVKPFWIFGIDRVVQNRTGLQQYGLYFALFNFSYLFGMVLDFGLNNFNNRALARHPNRLAYYLPNLLVIKLVLSLIYFLLVVTAALVWGYGTIGLSILSLLALNQILISYVLYLRSNLTARQLFKTDSMVSVLDRLLAIIFCGILLYTPILSGFHFEIRHFILCQTAALAVTAVVAFTLLRGRSAYRLRLWRWRFVRLILMKSAPFAMLGLLMTIYYRIDAIMLERMYSAGETGIYAQSYRLLDAVNQLGYLFGVPLLPMFASMIRRRESIIELLRLSAILMFLLSACTAILCAAYGSEIMNLLYHTSDPYNIKVFSLLMITFIPISSVYIFGTLLTANGNLKLLNIIAAGGIVINVVLNLILIPGYGAWGSTAATLFTQTVVALLHIYVAFSLFRIKTDRILMLRLALYVSAGLGLSFAILSLNLPWVLKLTLNAAALALIIPVFRLIPIKGFVQQVFSLVK